MIGFEYDLLEGNAVWWEESSLCLRLHYLDRKGFLVLTWTFYSN